MPTMRAYNSRAKVRPVRQHDVARGVLLVQLVPKSDLRFRGLPAVALQRLSNLWQVLRKKARTATVIAQESCSSDGNWSAEVMLSSVRRGDFRLFHEKLKPSNVLMSSDGSVFLTDYGFGRICCPMWSGAAAHRSCRDMESGTFDPLCWKAYEFFSGCSSFAMTMQNTHTSPTQSRETPHRQADVFSAAMLGYYAVTSGYSHPLINGDAAYRKTLHFYRHRIDRFADFVQLDQVAGPTARRVIFSMLKVDVKHRPDTRYVADHPAFWNDKKRNDFPIAVAEYVCANEKLMPQSILRSHVQSATLLRVLTTKKVASLNFAQRLNSTPENVAKIAARFGVKFEDASEAVALKTFYRQHRRQTNGTDKTMLSEEMEPLWDELAADIYDIVYPSPPLKLKPFFTK